MNTRTRRFMLRLIVGLLTFLIGVFAAIVIGNFNPLEGRRARVRVRRCAEYARPAPQPSIAVPVLLPDAPVAPRSVYPVYRPQTRFSQMPVPLPPQAAASVPPSFEDTGEIKFPRPVAPSHESR